MARVQRHPSRRGLVMSGAALPTHFRLSTGTLIPAIGLGTWKLKSPEVDKVLARALEVGYRHIDCAAVYDNEASIGAKLSQLTLATSSVKREDLFICSKLWNTEHSYNDALQAVEKTLQDLQLDYLDFYIIHWPFAFMGDEKGSTVFDKDGKALLAEGVTLADTWRAMETIYKAGKAKAIGVSNFNISHLEELMKTAKVKPAVNQVELHPYLPQDELFEFCKRHGIQLVAYAPLGSGREPAVREDQTILEVAEKEKLTPAQVLLSWAIMRGIVVIPKTANEDRVVENFHVKRLADESIKKIAAIKTRHRFFDPIASWKHSFLD